MADELLLIPGPTTLSPRVLQALSQPQIGHSSPEFYSSFAELRDLTKYIFKSQTGAPFVITGSGSLAMEASVVSLLEPGDRALVLETGHFGKRFALMAEIHEAKVDIVSFDFGMPAEVEVVEERLSKEAYKAVFLTHVDTSTTVANPIKEIVEVAKRHGAFTVVDSVCGVGGVEFDFDVMGVDIALSASQKALAGPPGAGLLVVSPRALEAFEKRKTPIRSYYMNLLRWKGVMDDPKIYLATPATNLMLALREALLEVKEEGLERRWLRHHHIAEALRAALEALRLEFVAEEGCRSDTVTGFYTPDGRGERIQGMMRQQFHIQVARGLYEHRDRMVRIAHLGTVAPRDILATASALEMTMRALGGEVKPGVAVEAATPHLERLMHQS